MQSFSIKFINKVLQLSIMFLPILIWDLYFIFQCFLKFPYGTYDVVTISCVFLLSISILFGNSYIKIHYTTKEELIIKTRKPNWIVLIKNIYFGIPILVSLMFYAGIPFYIYGILQFTYMIFDKNHYTITERIYYLCVHYYKKKKMKETLLA